MPLLSDPRKKSRRRLAVNLFTDELWRTRRRCSWFKQLILCNIPGLTEFADRGVSFHTAKKSNGQIKLIFQHTTSKLCFLNKKQQTLQINSNSFFFCHSLFFVLPYLEGWIFVSLLPPQFFPGVLCSVLPGGTCLAGSSSAALPFLVSAFKNVDGWRGTTTGREEDGDQPLTWLVS